MSESNPSSHSPDLDDKLQAEIEAALGDISLEDMVDLPGSPHLGQATPSESPSSETPAETLAAMKAATPGTTQSRSASTPSAATPGATPGAIPGAIPGSAFKPAPAVAHPTPARGSHRPQRGAQRERRIGTIINVHGQDVFVEFGPRAQGVCPLAAFPEMPKLGEKMEFILNRYDSDDELYILSRQGTVAKAEWESLDVGQSVEARCTGSNKGGLEMEVANHKAFMPAGQVDIRHIDKLDVFIGEKMPCEIIELDRKRGRIILSRRSHLETEREHLREKLMQTLDVGQTLPAVITSLKPYGAFADIGGMDGLIHISDLSYERIKEPSEVVKEGQQVEVRVLKIDESQTPPRIGLGLKQMQADPYEQSMATLTVGSDVTGKITKLMQFGAFMQVAPGVEGLIHISEMSHQRINRPSQIVTADEIVTARVLSIDPDSKKISLSLKALQETSAVDEEAIKREYQEGKSEGGQGHGDSKGHGSKGGGKGRGGDKRDRKPDPDKFLRNEDPHMKKLKAQLAAKFGDNLKGGIG